MSAGQKAIAWVFITFTGIIMLLYVMLLVDKITNPHYKNLGYDEFLVLGIILFCVLVLDIFLLIRLRKNAKR